MANTFKFGFSSDDHKDDIDGRKSESYEKKWDDCKEIIPKKNKLGEICISNADFKTINLDDVQIKFVCSNQVLETLRNQEDSKKVSVLQAELTHSDLLPAVYEGGFKIWECTYDLLNYLNGIQQNFENKKVLDLGCGAGIIGIYTLKKGSICYFQDYNSDVLEYITIPNILLNSEDCTSKCKFYSGDWEAFSNLIGGTNENDKFDFIFTSETIYNTENYLKLHRVFEKLLKKNGIIYLAAKSFYFGVGGGISLFEDFIDNYKVFKHSSCWKCTEGVKREILKIYFSDRS